MSHVKKRRSPQRFIALMILLVPGAVGVYGWKLMRDAIFSWFDPDLVFQGGMFLVGFLLFLVGVVFVGGFIFYRDRKRKKVQPRFQNDLDD